MAREKPKPTVRPLHELTPGPTPIDSVALLAEKTAGTTRDGKRYFKCVFRDARRAVTSMVWADSPLFAECERDWHPGTAYKLRGVFADHERYGLQIDLARVREVSDEDRQAGIVPAAFFERSRFDSDAMLAELRTLAEAEVGDVPLRRLVVSLLDAHADALKRLPASDRRYYPFPGGWLEHVLNVTKNCVWLADQYAARQPELRFNRDLVIAAAVLHEIGRVSELTPGEPGQPAEKSVAGNLIGHIQLTRDLVRDAAREVADLNAELLQLLEHVLLSYLAIPEWGSPRLPMVPEALILHHADDLDAKFEMFARCLTRDPGAGPFTEYDPVLKKPLFKGRTV